MRLSELQTKNIINLKDGSFVGKIIDIEIDELGKIINLIVEKNKTKLFFSSESNEIQIKFEQIKKLGNDVILIDMSWITFFFNIKYSWWI